MIGCINAFAKQCCSLCVFVTNESDVLNYGFRLCGRPPRRLCRKQNKNKKSLEESLSLSLCLCLLSLSSLSLSLSLTHTHTHTHTHTLSLSLSLSLLFYIILLLPLVRLQMREKYTRSSSNSIEGNRLYAQCGIPAKNKRM